MGRSFKQWAQAALAAGWIAWAGGCATPASTKAPPQTTQTTPSPAPQPQQQTSPQAQPQTTADPRFVLAPELKPILEVVSVHLHNPPAGGFLKIQVNVQNKTDLPQNFHYRVEWFDQDGVRLQLGEKEFEPWMLLPHETSSIAVTAPAMSVADFGVAFVP